MEVIDTQNPVHFWRDTVKRHFTSIIITDGLCQQNFAFTYSYIFREYCQGPCDSWVTHTLTRKHTHVCAHTNVHTHTHVHANTHGKTYTFAPRRALVPTHASDFFQIFLSWVLWLTVDHHWCQKKKSEKRRKVYEKTQNKKMSPRFGFTKHKRKVVDVFLLVFGTSPSDTLSFLYTLGSQIFDNSHLCQPLNGNIRVITESGGR